MSIPEVSLKEWLDDDKVGKVGASKPPARAFKVLKKSPATRCEICHQPGQLNEHERCEMCHKYRYSNMEVQRHNAAYQLNFDTLHLGNARHMQADQRRREVGTDGCDMCAYWRLQYLEVDRANDYSQLELSKAKSEIVTLELKLDDYRRNIILGIVLIITGLMVLFSFR